MAHQIRKNMPPLPETMRHLPVSAKGYVVPFFVTWFDGKPDFRVINLNSLHACVEKGLCWVCGKKLGMTACLVAGPMMAMNRLSSEPPSHPECAEYAVKSCPFMLYPKSIRRESNLPEGTTQNYSGDQMLTDNPGVTVIWESRSMEVVPCGEGIAFVGGPPESVSWYSEGQPATRDRALKALHDRYSKVKLDAGPGEFTREDMDLLDQMYVRASMYLPA